MNNIIIFKYKVRIIKQMIGGKINLDIKKRGKMMKVAVVMGSKSDYPKVQEGIELLEKYGVSVVVRVLSAHRTPVQLTEFLNEIEDEEILSAIRWHTTGKENMSKLDKIIYLADMIEPSRDFSGVEELRNDSKDDLDKAMLNALTYTIKYLLEKGCLIDVNTVKARNYLLYNNYK